MSYFILRGSHLIDYSVSSFIRIDEIHQQLEEQLSVLAHFIDGVASLRPKGLYH